MTMFDLDALAQIDAALAALAVLAALAATKTIAAGAAK